MPRWVPSVRRSCCGFFPRRAAPSPSQNATPPPEVSARSRFPARDEALPKPVPLPSSSSPPCSISSASSKVYLLTFKPLYFHAGSRERDQTSLACFPTLEGLSPRSAPHPHPPRPCPAPSASASSPRSKSISVFQIQRLLCLKNEAALHRGNREINTGYIEFPRENKELLAFFSS